MEKWKKRKMKVGRCYVGCCCFRELSMREMKEVLEMSSLSLMKR